MHWLAVVVILQLLRGLTSRNTSLTCLDEPSGSNRLLFAFIVGFSVITVCGNVLVIVVISITRCFRRKNTYILFLSLAVADLFVGCLIMPISARRVYNNRLFCMSEVTCWSLHCLERTLSIASMSHLFVIGIDRFLSLRKTFMYNQYATHRTCYVVIACIWLYALFCSLAGVFKWSSEPGTSIFSIQYNSKFSQCGISNNAYFTAMYMLCFFVPISIMLYTYSYVYRTTVRHLKDIAFHELGLQKDRELRRKRRQYRSFQSVTIVFVVYLLCWLPYAITHLLYMHQQEKMMYFRTNYPQFFKIYLIIVGDILTCLNSISNPFIYVISNRVFRRRIVELIAKRTHVQGVESELCGTFKAHLRDRFLIKNHKQSMVVSESLL